MRTLVHLSDLHFGRVDETLLSPLIKTVHDLKPDLVAVSGDLTQRARREQFKEARAFLDALPRPQIIVPGNHDVPLYNVFARFFTPLTNYRRYITDDLQPFYQDAEMAVCGVNTARSLTIKDGRINTEQIAWVRERLCSLGDEVLKIIVTHHPFDLPAGHDEDDLVGRAHIAVEAFAACGADLLVSGHLHISHTGHTAARYQFDDADGSGKHSALVVQAGTATSTRGRGEANSFNVLRLAPANIAIERFVWQPAPKLFISAQTERFRHDKNGWVEEQANAEV